MPRLDRPALGIALAAFPLRLALALLTELSPDEAYYLSAARLVRFAIPDHPPMTLWLLAAADKTSRWLPVELAARWPWLLLGAAVSVGMLELVRRRGGEGSAQRWTAILSSWLALPLAGGFLATPDTPCIAALIALMLAEEIRSDRAAIPVGAIATAAGMLSKVSFAPIALAFVAFSRRGVAHRAAIAIALAAATVPGLPSLAFQTKHAFAPAGWSFGLALVALVAAVAGQAGLWTPTVAWLGLRRWRAMPRGELAAVIVLAAAFGASALLRAVPPEPNWLAPAWIPLLLVAAPALAASRPAVRALTLVLGPALPLIFATHVARPWLPLPEDKDPSARLHGWSSPHQPIHAAGVGPYGPAAERCIYQRDCEAIAATLAKPSGATQRW